MRRKNLSEEAVRIASEYETAVAELATAEADGLAELNRLAGAEALREVTPDEARERRLGIRADLDARRERLVVLQDALPEIERRRIEEELTRRKGERRTAEEQARDCGQCALQREQGAVFAWVEEVDDAELEAEALRKGARPERGPSDLVAAARARARCRGHRQARV